MADGHWVHAEILKVTRTHYYSIELSSANADQNQAKARVSI
jgi:hypothetical protein